MKKNIGSGDQAIRTLLAAIIIVLYFSNIVTGTIGIVLLGLAGYLITTSLAGFCPLYTLLGINTNEVRKA
jgi:ABC-type transport system involved in cytochrome bd biosynthesis fused ATPase/permease subunit